MNTVNKKYKIFSFLYMTILFFVFFFLLVIFFASGHKVKIGIEFYLTFSYITINAILLFKFPRIVNDKIKKITGYGLSLILIINSILSLYFVFGLAAEDFVPTFDFFTLLLTSIFIISSSIIIFEIFKILNKQIEI